jgi:hypothetical protein
LRGRKLEHFAFEDIASGGGTADFAFFWTPESIWGMLFVYPSARQTIQQRLSADKSGEA